MTLGFDIEHEFRCSPFSSGQIPTDWSKEATAARILHYPYVQPNTDLWKDITQAIDISFITGYNIGVYILYQRYHNGQLE